MHVQIKDYGDLSYLLEAEYERQLVALSQDAELMTLPIGTRGLSRGKVSLTTIPLACPTTILLAFLTVVSSGYTVSSTGHRHVVFCASQAHVNHQRGSFEIGIFHCSVVIPDLQRNKYSR